MPFPLHKPAEGLLSLLRLRQQGASPNLASETVVPTVDTTGYYGVDLLRRVFSATTAAIGTANSMTIPTGEAWEVITMTARIDIGALAAGDVVTARVAVTLPASPAPMTVAEGFRAVDVAPGGAAAGGCAAVWVPARPVVLPAGTVITFFSSGFVAAGNVGLVIESLHWQVGNAQP